MNYNKTLNLPVTDFAMRAQLPTKEPDYLEFWKDINLYEEVKKKRSGAPSYILHDGPPYANGAIHMGHALNKILKDIVVKYSTMKGMNAPYVPGWDTHGLPIEHQVLKNKKVKRSEISTIEFRNLCRDYAMKFVDVQREQFVRLGVRGEWDKPYITLEPSFEAKQIEVFGKMAEKGFIYKGLKPVYWCPSCETALAEAEIEYEDVSSHSIYVKFPLSEEGNKSLGGFSKPVYCLIWTTTPWTIPANLAIALHPRLDYVFVDTGEEIYLLAEGLLEETCKEAGGENWKVIKTVKGSELENLICYHPIYKRETPILNSDFVTLEQGTGCVHIAPGHGLEDYEVGRKYKLDILSPVDYRGCFTEEAGPFAGLHYLKGNEAVISYLEENKALLKSATMTHPYPHCWRCKKAVIFRATEQWFASVEGFRKEALEAIRKVKWFPGWGEERIFNMVEDRQDWCISRQRVWGVPIPAVYCHSCNFAVINERIISKVKELFAEEGSDAWFKREAEDFIPADFSCPQCGEKSFYKETDIMDVWFDSGSSHIAVCDNHDDLSWPADLYLEGSDQYRGWFQSSLLTSVAIKGEPPYRAVLSHGWVVDGEGKKMSKSLGNVISPEEVIKQYGADILRLWVSSSDFTRDVHLSNDIIKQLTEVYRKIRNTSRFLLGNLFDFAPEIASLENKELDELDRWALARMQILMGKVKKAYENFEYHQVFHSIHNFCVVDMSNFYLNINKDKLYCSLPSDPARRSTQAVMYYILKNLTLLISPILTFTSEEIWQKIPGDKEKSIQLADWPEVIARYEDEELLKRWELLLKVRDEVMRSLEGARGRKEIKDTLEADLIIYAENEVLEGLRPYGEQLKDIFIVSDCSLKEGLSDIDAELFKSENMPIAVKVSKVQNCKCQRCWVYSNTVKDEESICTRCDSVVKELS